MSDFESAVDAVISGDVAALRSMLQRDPELVRRRSEREHRATVLTALAFGFLETAQVLAARGAPLNLAAFAGLGRVDDVARLLPASDPESRHVALVLAAVHGQVAVVRLLLDAGEDPNRFNPDGYHAHSTPLHQALWSNQLAVVRELVERGARVDIRDTVHRGTPLDWAIYGGREKIAEYLSRGS